MALSLIVAMSDNRVIGRDGTLPWRLSSDLRRFKRLTMGHHLIMGRLTFDSIGRPLPGRTTIVVSRTADYDDPAIKLARSLDQAIQLCADDHEPFVTGGARIFAEALPYVQRLYVTRVHACVEGDVFFPEIAWDHWDLVDQQAHSADEKNDHPSSFLTFVRRDGGA